MQQAQAVQRSSFTGQRTHVLLVGHSYIRRLDENMRRTPGRQNLGYNTDRIVIRCVGQGGAVLRPGDPERCILSVLSTALVPHPNIVFLHIGENDVKQLSPPDISAAIIALTDYITAVCHPTVIICSELFPFPTLSTNPADVVTAVNMRIQEAIQARNAVRGDTQIVYWRHEMGQWNPSTDLYLPDRVHLNETGMRRYWRSVRTAVGRAVGPVVSRARESSD